MREVPQGSGAPDARMTASLHLTDQGKTLLFNGKPDEAITVLERSLRISAENAQSYYYLAEAWLRKGNPGLAAEFNKLADVYTPDGNSFSSAIENQKRNIMASQNHH